MSSFLEFSCSHCACVVFLWESRQFEKMSQALKLDWTSTSKPDGWADAVTGMQEDQSLTALRVHKRSCVGRCSDFSFSINMSSNRSRMREIENVTKAYQNKNESPHTQDIFSITTVNL